MNTAHKEDRASQIIRASTAALRSQLPDLSNVLNAFEDLLAERAEFRADLPPFETVDLAVDAEKYRQGVPMFNVDSFSVPKHLLRDAAQRLIPAMQKGFPGIASQSARIGEFLKCEALSTENSVGPELFAMRAETERMAERAGVEPPVVKFVIFQLLKPFAEKRAESIATLLNGLTWVKGYCPICGSWPELSFLDGAEGRRWLRCSFCAHHWPYMRTSCPFCETSDQGKIEIIFSADRSWERAELCHDCKKYVVSLDLRNMTDKPPFEVAVLGLVHLDVLAQEKGFDPGAPTVWNSLVE